MIQTHTLTGQCPHCGATAEKLAYHSRYRLKSGQMVYVIRCKQHKGTFCDRYGTAFYDLKTPEEKVQRALHQELEGLCPESIARVEQVHPTTVQRWIERAAEQANAADKKVVTNVQRTMSNWTNSIVLPAPNIRRKRKTTLTRLASIGCIARWRANPACCSKWSLARAPKSRRWTWWKARLNA